MNKSNPSTDICNYVGSSCCCTSRMLIWQTRYNRRFYYAGKNCSCFS